MTISTISNSMSSFVPKYWLNWQILVAVLVNFVDRDGITKVYIPVHPRVSHNESIEMPCVATRCYICSLHKLTVLCTWSSKNTSKIESSVNIKIFIGLKDLSLGTTISNHTELFPFGSLDDKVWNQ